MKTKREVAMRPNRNVSWSVFLFVPLPAAVQVGQEKNPGVTAVATTTPSLPHWLAAKIHSAWVHETHGETSETVNIYKRERR